MSTTTDKASAPHPMPMESRIAAMWEDAEYEWGEAVRGPPAWELFAHKIISAMRQDFEVVEAAEQAFESVPLPRSVNMARMMLALGHRYLSEHAPEHLSKREASTEPSAPQTVCFACDGGGYRERHAGAGNYLCSQCGGSGQIAAIMAGAGALPDEAKDAARLDFIADNGRAVRHIENGTRNLFLWDSDYPAAEAGLRSNFRASLDRAAIAQSKAGKGQA